MDVYGRKYEVGSTKSEVQSQADRQCLGVFAGVFGDNPGGAISLTRDVNTGLVRLGEAWPVLLRDTNRLFPAPFSETPVFPIAVRPNRADNLNAFHPDTKI